MRGDDSQQRLAPPQDGASVRDSARLTFSSGGAQRVHQSTQRARFVLNREVIREVRKPADIRGSGISEADAESAWQMLRELPGQRLWLVKDINARCGVSLLITRCGAS